MNDAETIVRNFCAAFSRRNIEEILGYFAADAVYHNMPIDPVQGTEGIRAMLEQFVGPAESAEFEILHLAVNGNVVHTERVDRFFFGPKKIPPPDADAHRRAVLAEARALKGRIGIGDVMRVTGLRREQVDPLMSRRNTSCTPLVSPVTISVADETNATYCPLLEMTADDEGPFGFVPRSVTETISFAQVSRL